MLILLVVMKIVVAMDSFKGSLSANEACEIVAKTIAECVPTAQIVIKPMADGGEGTARAMIEAADGQWIPRTVMIYLIYWAQFFLVLFAFALEPISGIFLFVIKEKLYFRLPSSPK